jgi:dUTP pyrophosphatase
LNCFGGAVIDWSTVKILVKRTAVTKDLPLPSYMTDGASGMDLFAAVDDLTIIEPGAWNLVPTGLSVAVPAGFELQIRPRSGLAVKYGIGILNSPGTIDSDYRGEIKIILINLGQKEFIVKRGDRIAQMVVVPVIRAAVEERSELPPTARDSGGFGHTG